MSARWLRLVLIVASLDERRGVGGIGAAAHDPGRALPEHHARSGTGCQELRAAGPRAGSRARLGPGVRIEWYAYNAGPSAMEAIFAESLDLTYVGPNPAINAYARSDGRGNPRRCRRRQWRVGTRRAAGRGPRRAVGFPRQADRAPRSSVTPRMSPRAPGSSAGGLRITQAGGDAQVLPTANPDQLALFHDQAAGRGLDRRALGLAARAGSRWQDTGRGEGRGHDAFSSLACRVPVRAP